jgi:hypothetical protein
MEPENKTKTQENPIKAFKKIRVSFYILSGKNSTAEGEPNSLFRFIYP